MVDDHDLPVFANFAADRRLDLEFAARLQAKGYVVAHTAGDPAVFRHARHRRKAHACGLADHLENGRHHAYLGDHVYGGKRGVAQGVAFRFPFVPCPVAG
ncbi:hypothetical protein [Rhizobium sp. 32-5/1]|uniref:hypothetical protein n=1 Tax=Rhizobium sp. 32-5/1 TaxID=3019602 RepID=UPI0032B7A930